MFLFGTESSCNHCYSDNRNDKQQNVTISSSGVDTNASLSISSVRPVTTTTITVVNGSRRRRGLINNFREYLRLQRELDNNNESESDLVEDSVGYIEYIRLSLCHIMTVKFAVLRNVLAGDLNLTTIVPRWDTSVLKTKWSNIGKFWSRTSF